MKMLYFFLFFIGISKGSCIENHPMLFSLVGLDFFEQCTVFESENKPYRMVCAVMTENDQGAEESDMHLAYLQKSNDSSNTEDDQITITDGEKEIDENPILYSTKNKQEVDACEVTSLADQDDTAFGIQVKQCRRSMHPSSPKAATVILNSFLTLSWKPKSSLTVRGTVRKRKEAGRRLCPTCGKLIGVMGFLQHSRWHGGPLQKERRSTGVSVEKLCA